MFKRGERGRIEPMVAIMFGAIILFILMVFLPTNLVRQQVSSDTPTVPRELQVLQPHTVICVIDTDLDRGQQYTVVDQPAYRFDRVLGRQWTLQLRRAGSGELVNRLAADIGIIPYDGGAYSTTFYTAVGHCRDIMTAGRLPLWPSTPTPTPPENAF